MTFLPAVEADVVGLSIIAVTMSETLEVTERVCISDHAVRIEGFGFISAPKSPSV